MNADLPLLASSPVRTIARPPGATPTAQHLSASGTQASILIVDDEIQNCKLLEALLRPEGYLTHSATTGEEALALIALHAPDLILIDIMMPGMDGYQLVRNLKASISTSNIPIIMVTVLDDRTARLASLNAGAEDFLTRPVDPAELQLRVRNLLRLKALNDRLEDQGAFLERQVLARTAELHRFRAAMDVSGDAIVLVDRAGMRYVDVNQTLCDMVGYTRQDLLQMTPMALLGVDRAVLERDYDAIIEDDNCSASNAEGNYRHSNGSLIPIETRRRAMLTDNGWIIVDSARDITGQKLTEHKVGRLNRVYAVLSRINALILRAGDRDEVFSQACRIAVENGQFKMAWIGVADWSAMKIVPIASAGAEPEFLTLIQDRFSLREDAPMGNTRSALAVREKRAIVANEIQDGTAIFFAKERAERGIRSLAILPLLVADHAIGMFALYSSELGFFDEDEMKLLQELAGNISFAIEHIDKARALERVTRVNAMLSSINGAIVRIRDSLELFEEVCKIAVSAGEFILARMVEVAPDRTARIVATSEADTSGFRRVLDEHNANPELSGNLLGLAIRSGQPVVSNDVANDPRMPNRVALTQDGNYAVALLPVSVEKRVAGVMVLRAREAGAFDDKEMHLLLELVANISFALELLDKRKRVEYLAYYDALTGLANRSLFLDRVAQHMRNAAGEGHKLALILIDIERFKNLNDTLGRPAGDALLKQVGDWLAHNAGDASLLARLDADHFAAVLPKVEKDGDVGRLLEKTMNAFLEHPFRVNDAAFRIAVKVGVSIFPDDATDADTLFKNAEAALKKAKASGDRFLFYSQKMTEATAGKLVIENQLRRALQNGEFVLHYQPKRNFDSGKLTGAEALIRWNDPRTGLVPPGRFIPVLEEIGLIYDVGRWALRKALEDYLRWRATGLPAVRVAVNVSPLQLRSHTFIAEIRDAIGMDPQAAAGLELEITESLIMADVKHSIASLQAIRAMGVTIAIDDFGTGFSSLSYLAKLPVDTLKIDRSFVIDMTASPQGLALVSTTINLAHSLNLKVVAEGVETEEQSRLLRLLRCDEMQGFLFSKAVPVETFEKLFLAPPAAAPQ